MVMLDKLEEVDLVEELTFQVKMLLVLMVVMEDKPFL